MAAKLIDLGINATEIYNLAFNNFSLNRLKLFGHCISNNMKIVEDKKLAYMWIDRRTKTRFDIQDGDTEGLVNYPMKVLDIEVSVLFKQDYDKIRISFRSKNNVDVNKIARQYFNGGGHINAAGGMSKQSLEETLAYFESLIPTIF
jgi:phosphoesterase RecJ-like protein